MTSVENTMKIGVGPECDTAALYAAGAQSVVRPSRIPGIIEVGAFRAGDTLIMSRPKALSASQYADLNAVSEGKGLFQVVGHEAGPLGVVSDFMALVPKVGVDAPVREATGRRPSVNYTLEQAEAILREYWKRPKLSPPEVMEFVHKQLELKPGTLKFHWVKMLARKYTGTAKREMPVGWKGLTEKEQS